MKKFIALLLAATLTLSAAACGSAKEEEPVAEETTKESEEPEEAEEPEEVEDAEEPESSADQNSEIIQEILADSSVQSLFQLAMVTLKNADPDGDKEAWTQKIAEAASNMLPVAASLPMLYESIPEGTAKAMMDEYLRQGDPLSEEAAKILSYNLKAFVDTLKKNPDIPAEMLEAITPFLDELAAVLD